MLDLTEAAFEGEETVGVSVGSKRWSGLESTATVTGLTGLTGLAGADWLAGLATNTNTDAQIRSWSRRSKQLSWDFSLGLSCCPPLGRIERGVLQLRLKVR